MDSKGRIDVIMLCLYAVGSLVLLVSTLEVLAVGQCQTLFRFKPHINCTPSPTEDLRLRDGWPGCSNHTKNLNLNRRYRAVPGIFRAQNA
jgi:hypothetical protein